MTAQEPIDAPVDEAACRTYLEHLYSAGCPDKSFVTVSWKTPERKEPWSYQFRSDDLDGAAAKLVDKARRSDTWLNVGLRRDLGRCGKRGDEKDVVAMPGVFLDVDIAGPAHKGSKYPPDEDAALKIVKAMPLAPTFVLRSGHGYVVGWLFEHVEPTTKDVKTLSDRWNKLRHRDRQRARIHARQRR